MKELTQGFIQKHPLARVMVLNIIVILIVVISMEAFGSKASVAYANRVTATCSNNASTDANALNSAISSSSPGDEIDIQGPCLLNATITLLGDRAYSGYSRTGTVLTQANGANLTALFASDSFVTNSSTTGDPIAIRHLTLDGNRANNTAATDGIVLRSWMSTIEDVQITNMGGNGIRETNLSANGTALTNTQVNGRIAGNFIENSGHDGIYIQDTGNALTDTILAENWVADSGVDGIHMENAAGWIVERNHIYGVQQKALYVNRAYASSISDNYIEDFGDTSTGGTWYGIDITIQGDAASTIMGNRVFNFNGEGNTASTYIYLAISNVNYGTGNASITGNTIRGAGSTRSTGLSYSKGNGTALIVTSTGNLVSAVNTNRYVGTGVTLSAGV